MKCSFHLVLAAVLCLAACGTPGAPRPPSLDLPKPVSDLTATRVGDKVTLTWTVPRETTDNQNIRHPGPVRVCRAVDVTPLTECPDVAQLPPASVPPARKAKQEQRRYTDTLPAHLQQQYPTGFATYALESVNPRGRGAGLSNQVQVPLAPTLPAAQGVSAEVSPDAITVKWKGRNYGNETGEKFDYHLYRSEFDHAGAVDLGAGEVGSCLQYCGYSFVDRTFEWEKTYLYSVIGVTIVTANGKATQIQGEPSTEIKVFARDVYPPAVPAGLQAVASGVGQAPFVDLTWTPDTDRDLAGYNVYRHEAGRPPVKINAELVKTPAYRDRAAAPGHKYFYSVSAVDLRGNESARSPETSESIP